MPDETVRVTELPFNCFNASFSPDGNFLAVATRLGVAVFDARSLVKVGESSLGLDPLWCSPILFSSDNSEVSFVNWDRQFVRVEISRQANSQRIFWDKTSPVCAVARIPDNRFLACLQNGSVLVLEPQGGSKLVHRISPSYGMGPVHVEVAPDARWAAICWLSDRLELIDLKSGNRNLIQSVSAPRTAVFVDSSTLFVGTSSGEVYRVDIGDDAPQVRQLLKRDTRCVSLTQVGASVWSFSLDGCCTRISLFGDVQMSVLLADLYGNVGFGRINPAGTAAFVATVKDSGLLVDLDQRPMAVAFKKAIAAGDTVAEAQYTDWKQDN